MSLFSSKNKKDQGVELRRRRLVQPELKRNGKQKRGFELLLFLGLWVILALVAFWGETALPSVFPNRISKVRILANFAFEYTSDIKTQQLKEQRKQTVSPVYKIDLAAFKSFGQKIDWLKQRLNAIAALPNHTPQNLQAVVDEFEKHNLTLQVSDLEILLRLPSETHRNRLLEEGLFILQEVSQKGIFDETDISLLPSQNPHFFSLYNDKGSQIVRLQSKGNALRFLRMNLWAMDIEYEVANALVHILKFGLIPNFVYDKEKTETKIKEFIENTPPVVVKVSQGEPIVESGQVVSQESYEKLIAYQKLLRQKEDFGLGFKRFTLKKIFFTLLALGSVMLALHILPTKIKKSKRCLAISSLVLIINIFLIRLLNELGTTALFGSNLLFLSLIPYCVPILLGSILLTVLMDPLAGLLIAIAVNAINTLMQSGGLDYFLWGFLGSSVVTYLCKTIRLREGIAKASAGASAVMAASIFLQGILSKEVTTNICLQQSLATIGSGFLSLILALGLLPLFEKLFRYTTNITLLELTDYNHPLLRKLQMVCPGTYHHSLMVAALAEQVASEIGANPLLCRCCALYHDIGKIVKPEYFTENQSEFENPHEKHSPSISALILKSHVKEGVEIARNYQLPQVIIDIIQQHHGTSQMQYFYQKALRLQNKGENLTSEKIDESIFRYEGPKPQFKESAIISLADAVEAASRSLTKITPQTVEELIGDIVKDRIADNQLNECNLTFKEVDRMKHSFQFVLLNMLHSRVSYPKAQSNPANSKKQVTT